MAMMIMIFYNWYHAVKVKYSHLKLYINVRHFAFYNRYCAPNADTKWCKNNRKLKSSFRLIVDH